MQVVSQVPKTLAQRVACWRPFRRWLLANDLPVFPSGAEQVVRYLEVQTRAGAPRTALASLLSSLRFLEEAGEVAIAGVKADKKALVGEVADLVYHALVLLSASGATPEEVWRRLRERRG